MNNVTQWSGTRKTATPKTEARTFTALCLMGVTVACSGQLDVEEDTNGEDGSGGSSSITSGTSTQGAGGSDMVSPDSTGSGGTISTSTSTATTGAGGVGGAPETSCQDRVKNAAETDIDCGGDQCPECPRGGVCESGSDCEDGVCVGDVCQAPSCDDGLENGEETGVDCGGPGCEPCGSNEVCDCGESDYLAILNCGQKSTGLADRPLLSEDGSVVVFMQCVGSSECYAQVLRWEDGETELVATDKHAPLMNRDGQVFVMQDGGDGDFTLVTPDGEKTVDFTGRADGLSNDGSHLLATRYPFGEAVAEIWTEAGGFEPLGALDGVSGWTIARDLSADGTVAVGYVHGNENDVPVLWQNGVAATLGGLPEDTPNARAVLVSDDGSTVVGTTSFTGSNTYHAVDVFRWTENDGLMTIAPAIGLMWDPELLMVSDDGSVVAGTLDLSPGDYYPGAFRYTPEEGLVYLVPGGSDYQSVTHSMSADGNVIVGALGGGYYEPTFVWEPDTGAVTLDERLEELGVDVDGWEFGGTTEISADGNVVVGLATCHGVPALYRAVLSEP